MTWFKTPANSSTLWFRIGLLAIFLVSVVLRFWGLSRFNTLVFDEVYYAKFANNYLTGTQFKHAHPPLSAYIIAMGMWIGSHLPFGQDTINGLTGSLRTPWSYRWLNALTGSFIPLVVAAIAYQLNRRHSYALIAALFAAADGLFLVESRYALNNVYLVILGLLGQLFFLIALSQTKHQRWQSLALSGVFFGACACIKWNGLWFLLGVYFVWGTAWIIQWRTEQVSIENSKSATPRYANKTQNSKGSSTPLINLTQLNGFHIIWYFYIIPALTYSLLWIPHLIMNPKPEFPGFWESQKYILEFHEKIGSGSDVHPYCSQWYTWLFMLRPVAYFYQTAQTIHEQVPVYPPLPAGYAKVIYDVHAMGNPILWWLSTAAILIIFLLLVQRLVLAIRGEFASTATNYMSLYLVMNWLANLLPWVRVTRCIFLYHYMGSSVFAGLGLAWIMDRWLHREREHRQWKNAAKIAIALVVVAFIFWLPIYLGLPLPAKSYRLWMWFRCWI